MRTDSVQGIAEDQAIPSLRIVQGFNAHVVSRAKQPFAWFIPDHECEITQKMPHTIRTPNRPGMQDQLRIGCVFCLRTAAAAKLIDQFFPRVNPAVRGDPGFVADSAGLVFPLGCKRASQHGVPKTDVLENLDFLRVWPAVCDGLGKSPEKLAIRWSTIDIDDDDEPAHAALESRITRL